MPLSVLHISDLHRDPNNPIGNDVLLNSLERDRDRYTSIESPRVNSPELIIVSGDIVQGVKHDTTNANDILKRQYDEALDFLTNLTDRFLQGNKSRIIVVPGNHDVSDHVFRQSLDAIPVPDETAARKELFGRLSKPDSPLRWSWDDLTLYRIIDPATYDARCKAFCDFYNQFFTGLRSYSANPQEQVDVVDFPDFGLTVAAFSSCHNNDPLNRQGAIHPDCLASAAQRLREISLNHERLQLAVWHHNVEGPPLETDYMDPDTVQNFIDAGISLGFHGHQHRPQFLDTRFRHGPDRKIAVISAGTLCGDSAFRFGRSYNIVELHISEYWGRLHPREMQNDNLQMPIWGSNSRWADQKSYLEFYFDPPLKPFIPRTEETVKLTEAQRAYDRTDYETARGILAPIFKSNSLARRMLLRCLQQLNSTPEIIKAFDPPDGPEEIISLMDALWQEGKRDRLKGILKSELVGKCTDESVVELRRKYLARLER